MQRTQMEIIEYADKYKEWVNSLIARLQNFERTIESDRLPGEEMTEKYLDHIVSECRKKDGKIYVAKMGEEIVGFVSAWVENGKGYVVSEKEQWLYVSDIFVAPEFRGKSIATLLIDHMESCLLYTSPSPRD